MRTPFLARTPAVAPAFLFAGTLLLSGCGLFSKDKSIDAVAVSAASGPPSFTLEVQAPKDVRELLEQHMELQRYRTLSDLRRTELTRLLGAADTDIRGLLGTLGYFAPTIELQLIENDVPPAGASAASTAPRPRLPAETGTAADPAAAAAALAARNAAAARKVLVTVEPGPQTHVTQAAIDFAGTNADDPKGLMLREGIRRSWGLAEGEAFTQDAWGSAKNDGLRRLQQRRYPTARILNSSADIDADVHQATLRVDYEPGVAYTFGPMRIELQRDNDLPGPQQRLYEVEGPIRLARIPVGQEYRQTVLLDAQQRLASSGLYDSVFLTLDTDAAQPGETEVQAPVIAQVREAKLQKWVYGLGFSTDTGARFSVDHIHNRVPYLGWRAVSKLQLDQKNPLLSTRISSMPAEDGWNRYFGGKAAREELADYTANSLSVVAGRSKNEDAIDRTYYLQYDMAKAQGVDAPPSSSSLTGNYGWTGRYFNNASNPTRGYGIAWEVGAGATLTPARAPFGRLSARGLYLHPFNKRDEDTGRRSRLALRAAAGAIVARDDTVVPLTQLFLSGGDTTVRGYSYQSIGTRTANGSLIGGRYMASGSVEWQRPITIAGNTSDWEHAMFVDAGTVTDQLDIYKVFVGVGTGIRWRSPVGPLQADLAYGLETRKLRLHLRLGFNF